MPGLLRLGLLRTCRTWQLLLLLLLRLWSLRLWARWLLVQQVHGCLHGALHGGGRWRKPL